MEETGDRSGSVVSEEEGTTGQAANGGSLVLREELIGTIGTDVTAGSPSGGPLLGTRWTNSSLPHQNRLLSLLPPHEREQLDPALDEVEVGLKHLLNERDAPIEHVYFPLNGVLSLVTIMEDGSSVEVGTVGNEGFVGLPAFLGETISPVRSFAQVPGVLLRMRVEDLRRHTAGHSTLRAVLQRYTQALFAMVGQAAACNRVHNAAQRLSLWLLMVHDRVGTETFPITQEFMAQMLGVRRATVSETASGLQDAGAIRYSRGILSITDRARLEGTACECYRIITGHYDRVLGPAWSNWSHNSGSDRV